MVMAGSRAASSDWRGRGGEAMGQSRVGFLGILGLFMLMTAVFTANASESPSPTPSIPLAGASIDDETVMTVNGEPVTRHDFVTRLTLVRQNLVSRRAELDANPDAPPYLVLSQQIMEMTAPEDIALASLILDTSVYQEAISQGYRPDPGLIEQGVAQDRMFFEQVEQNPAQFGIDPDAIAAFRASIDEIGEERYWGEMYPQMLEQQMAVEQYQSVVTMASGDQTGLVWLQIQAQIFDDAEVEITDQASISPATLDGARLYLHTLWDLISNILMENE
jgi:hypothetical protein